MCQLCQFYGLPTLKTDGSPSARLVGHTKPIGHRFLKSRKCTKAVGPRFLKIKRTHESGWTVYLKMRPVRVTVLPPKP